MARLFAFALLLAALGHGRWFPHNPRDFAAGGRINFYLTAEIGMASMVEPLAYNTTGYNEHTFTTSMGGQNCTCGEIRSNLIVSASVACMAMWSKCVLPNTVKTDGHCFCITVGVPEKWAIPPFTLVWAIGDPQNAAGQDCK